MDLFCQSRHSWQAIFLQKPGFIALALPKFLTVPIVPTAQEARLLEPDISRAKSHVDCRPFPGHQRLQYQGTSKRQANGLSHGFPQPCPLLVPLCTLIRFTSLWREIRRKGKKKFFCQKKSAFCTCTLVLNGIKSFCLFLVTGPGFCPTLQANHLFPLCAVFPICKAGKMHHREIYKFKDWCSQ